MNAPEPFAAAQAATSAVALADRTAARLRLSVQGPDRARFLHNLTTQDVKRLATGEGSEAFVTSPQGKTLGYVTLLAGDDSILLRSDVQEGDPVRPHLEKYGVFDEVQLVDRSGSTFELFLTGPRAEDLLRAAGAEVEPAREYRHWVTSVDGVSVRLVWEPWLSPLGLTVIGERSDLDRVSESLRRAGAALGLVGLDAGVSEALRIEAGTPAAGRDVTPENLPQEVARDSRTINFVKGCYLGQETVARIDALGHVNRLLRGLRPAGDVPPEPGSPVEADGKLVGKVTSAAYHPATRDVVALAYVRTSHAAAGTVLRVSGPDGPREAVVTDLPMPRGG